jgi:hypothetical protein
VRARRLPHLYLNVYIFTSYMCHILRLRAFGKVGATQIKLKGIQCVICQHQKSESEAVSYLVGVAHILPNTKSIQLRGVSRI